MGRGWTGVESLEAQTAVCEIHQPQGPSRSTDTTASIS